MNAIVKTKPTTPRRKAAAAVKKSSVPSKRAPGRPRLSPEQALIAREKKRQQQMLDKRARLEAARQVRERAREERAIARSKAKEELAAKRAARRASGEPDGERVTRPRAGTPLIKKDMVLGNEALKAPWSMRPLTGADLDALGKRFGLNASEFSSALGLQNRFAFTVLLRTSKVIPFDVEVLARLYEMSPTPAPWQSYTAEQVFKTLYEPLLDKFDGPEDVAYARTLYYSRFTATIGRSSATAYRWVENSGKARLVVVLLLRKIMSMPHPRETLERVAALVMRVRGGDLNLRAPIPQPGQRVHRRGRVADVSRLIPDKSSLGRAIKIKSFDIA
ncbi:MAG: hypothetical protein EPN79_10940 [Burkholderiaceae bacterium]|nr:MAG: hypothetical protein EPN79_10940 [Burkholderiaceae bacterium]TBR76801.1 MAG: hypothetical protein EPN64_06135 [Burkholderiaceae bacterium]